MNQEELAAMLRAQELQRRAVRRQVMLNYAALEEEELTKPEDIAADKLAKESLHRQQVTFENQTIPQFPSKAYWKRLWSAVRGKRV